MGKIEKQIEKVEWVDSTATTRWNILDKDLDLEDFTPVRITSYGILVKETDEYIELEQELELRKSKSMEEQQ